MPPTTASWRLRPASAERLLPPASGCSTTTTSSRSRSCSSARTCPPHYGVELPRLVGGRVRATSRASTRPCSLSSRTPTRASTRSTCSRFIDGYQEVAPLTIGEVWAIPIMLRIGARREPAPALRARSCCRMRAEKSADAWAERLVLAGAGRLRRPCRRCSVELDAGTRGTFAPAFFVRLVQRLGELETGGESVNAWLEHRLSADGIVLETAAAAAQQEQAANQVSIANSITSIRLLDALRLARVLRAASRRRGRAARGPRAHLRRDGLREPRPVPPRGRGASRAAPTTREIEVAEAIVELARRRAVASTPPTTCAATSAGGSSTRAATRSSARSATAAQKRERFYRGPLCATTALFYWGTLSRAHGGAARAAGAVRARPRAPASWQIALLLAARAHPAVRARARDRQPARVARSSRPKRLPKLDFRRPVDDVAPHARRGAGAAVVGRSRRSEVIEHLEIAYLANRDPNIALRAARRLEGARRGHPARRRRRSSRPPVRGISELNERYEAEHGVRPFHLLVRARRFNESEGVWMGWERKRGALLELVREMRGRPDTTFSTKLGDSAFRRSCTFVITLDADTSCRATGRASSSRRSRTRSTARAGSPGEPRVRARLRARAAARGHDAAGLASAAGSPRCTRDRPASTRTRARSPTPTRTSSARARSPARASSRSTCSTACSKAASPRTRCSRHDLVEGSFLRTALASDIEVLDDYPANYLAAASRLHRWVRGDWQTLPWLRPRVPDATGADAAQPALGAAPLEDHRQPAPLARARRRPLALFVARLAAPAGRGAVVAAAHGRSSCFFPAVLLARRLDGLPARARSASRRRRRRCSRDFVDRLAARRCSRSRRCPTRRG